MRIAVILGTRPEIIKFSPIIRECERLGFSYFVIHTGQHYSYNMDRIFFEQLDLPKAKYNLDIGSGSHAEQTGKIMIEAEKVLRKNRPDVVLIEGDTNTVLAGALAAVKLGISIGHVEAGLRSYDRKMPEEINRILADHCADFLFAPTIESKSILLKEGIPRKKIFVTGNTIVDAVNQNLKVAKRKLSKQLPLDLKNDGYFLCTIHRQENVDNDKRFRNILEGLELLQKTFDVPLIYPIHPRAKKQLKNNNIKVANIKLIDPLDYLTFLRLESCAKLVLTDSGGVQEEACILGVPCVTLRDNTERPETLKVGSNILAGTDSKTIVEKAYDMLARDRGWTNPFGDGKAARRILSILEAELD